MATTIVDDKWLEEDKEQRLPALLDRVGEVCSISETAQRVMDLTRAGEVDILSVVDAVMKDPALATELLRLANSPLFGQARQVKDIRRAVVVVGMQELHNIAAAMSMMAAFTTPEELSFELRASSVLSAALAKAMARELKEDESAAFLAGLLCEIGAMACIAIDSAEYNRIWLDSDGVYDKRSYLEKARYSASSEEIGGHVLVRNRLPDAVADAVSGKGNDEQEKLAAVTTFARRAAPLIIRAANEEDNETFVEQIPAMAEILGLSAVPVDRLFQICVDAATTAELSLRGELNLAEESATDSIVAGEPTEDPAAEAIKELADIEAAARKTNLDPARGTVVSFRVETEEKKNPWLIPAVLVAVVLLLTLTVLGTQFI